MSEAVVLTRRGPVLLIELNRPHRLNSVNSALGLGLLAALNELAADDALRVGVLTGRGRAFCTGMDLSAFLTDGDPEGIEEFVHRADGKPLIAAVEGYALAAGLEIALACDLIVAGAGARLGIPEVKVGLFAGGGGVVRLARRLPYGVAMRMALTGEPITAELGARYGLVAEVTQDGEALTAACQLAEIIAANAPLGVAHSRRLVQDAAGRTDRECWEMQDPFLSQVLASADAREGAAAFVARRSPHWTGR